MAENKPGSGDRWLLPFGAALIALSALVYGLHYLIFRDEHHIFLYMVGDIAFVFIEVLMVTLIIHRLLQAREKRARLEKLNMVIGAFFSEAGTQLLRLLSGLDRHHDRLEQELAVDPTWAAREYERVCRWLEEYKYELDPATADWPRLRDFLAAKREFLLRLLENPNLLEHETFTDLLQAVFHLTEELTARPSLANLPATDGQHLAGDVNRVFGQLAEEWLRYLQHLKGNYPYLFSLAVRLNPFNREASPTVKG